MLLSKRCCYLYGPAGSPCCLGYPLHTAGIRLEPTSHRAGGLGLTPPVSFSPLPSCTLSSLGLSLGIPLCLTQPALVLPAPPPCRPSESRLLLPEPAEPRAMCSDLPWIYPPHHDIRMILITTPASMGAPRLWGGLSFPLTDGTTKAGHKAITMTLYGYGSVCW